MIVQTKSVEIRQPSRQCAFEDTNFIWLVKQRVLFLLYDDSVWVMANWPFLFIYLLYIESGRTWVKSIGPEVKWSPTPGARGRQRSPARQEQAVQG